MGGSRTRSTAISGDPGQQFQVVVPSQSSYPAPTPVHTGNNPPFNPAQGNQQVEAG